MQPETLSDISQFCGGHLRLNEEGIWIANDQPEISYPEDGNRSCFEVEDRSFWFQHRNQVISDLVSQFSPESVFFDVGGGNGCVSYALQTLGISTVLVEPGSEGALNAQKRGLRTVVQATLDTANFNPGSLESVGVFDVVEHIENDEQFLKDIHKYLMSGGHLYITVPAYNFLWSSDDVQAGHFRRYSKASLCRLLRKCGFNIDYSGYLFSPLVLPIMLARTLPSLLGFRKAISEEITSKEHSGGSELSSQILRRLLRRESKKVRANKVIRFGSSVIAVAHK